MRSRRIATAVSLVVTMLGVMGVSASSTLAAAEPHPKVGEFGPLANPNGIAVDEASGDVYVATLGVDEQQTVTVEGEPSGGSLTLEFEGEKASLTVGGGGPYAGEVETALTSLSKVGSGNVSVSQTGELPGAVAYTVTFQGSLAARSVPRLACDGSLLTGGTSPSCKVATTIAGVENKVNKFDAEGHPVAFFALGGNELTGAGTPAKAFAFPLAAYGTPAAIAVDNSTNPSDPSDGDLYVMDAGHGVIDKFSPSGEYLSQITGFKPFNPTGSAGEREHELLGLAVDGSGGVRVDLNNATNAGWVEIDVFDDTSANHLVAQQLNTETSVGKTGVPPSLQEAYGFAVGPTGDDYLLYESCSCVVKLGQQTDGLGRVDNAPSGDVALATDPATGHLYSDSQSSIAEWDTGAMNGSEPLVAHETKGAATQVGASFGALSGSSGQGGIAVNGASGRIYVSDPGAGKVDVFGSDFPAVTAGAADEVTKETARLNGTVDPRGAAIAECEFEYGVADEFGRGAYQHSAACEPAAAGIGSGSSPVPVSAHIEGLEPGLLYRFRLITENVDGLKGESSGLLATLGVGFGVKSFEVSFLNQDGTPDTQAGSHPYELRNDIEFNSRFMRVESNADSPFVREPDGTLKDFALDLPPGLVGDPNATPKKCTPTELLAESCPLEAFIGTWNLEASTHIAFGEYIFHEPIYNIVAPRGVAAQFGVRYDTPDLFINNGLLAGGDYPIQVTVNNPPAASPILFSRVTIFGVAGSGSTRKAFLTLPTGCHGPLRSTLSMDSYQEPDHMVKAVSVTHNAAGTPVSLTGCSKLTFPPTISVAPDTTNASTSSGLTVGVHVPQTAAQNPDGLAESSLRDTTVALPAGVALNPSGANGLEACSEGLAGFEIGHGVNGSGFEEFNPESEPGVKTALFSPTALEELRPGVSLCPGGSKIGTVKIASPLLPKGQDLEGSVYLASQQANPFGSLIAMYLMVEDPISGSTVKLTGEVQLCEAAGQVVDGVSCQGQGQIITTFKNTPDIPFEELELHFFGGERAPLATPSRCGTYTTQAVFTPWDGNGPVTSTSSFQIDHGPGGGPCPGASLPFTPSLTGGATNLQAGAFSPFTLTMNRKDGEQNLQSVEAHLPPGMLGVLSNIELCSEPQANLGECGPNSLIGETTVSVGVGNQPFTVSGGKFYLTGPYNGSGACTVGTAGCAPFGVSFEVPAKAGPFDLANTQSNHPACDCVLVRGKIEVNPETSAITIVSNPPGTPDAIPTSIAGIPLEIQHINATTTRGDFQFNPTNCNKMEATGTIHSSEGGVDTVGVPFQVTNCADLKFAPKFAVSTSGKTSRAKGASLSVKLTYPKAPFGSQANVARVKVDLPKQLPSRLTTLQKACTAAQFNANPAGCPAASFIGHAKAITPIIPVPLEGPAIFVSHGGEAFPSLIVVLQGYGVRIDLVGTTFISKAGITSSTFKTIPDAPIGSFELNLPEGKYSALAANGNLCTSKLAMPTEFLAQNGAKINQSTPVSVTGCAKKKTLTRAQKLTAALKACHRKAKGKRATCQKQARKRYGPLKKAKRGKK
jgi:hypothetical protein